jgi:hypothetical protein
MKAGRFVVDTHVHAQRFAAGKGISARPPETTGGSQWGTLGKTMSGLEPYDNTPRLEYDMACYGVDMCVLLPAFGMTDELNLEIVDRAPERYVAACGATEYIRRCRAGEVQWSIDGVCAELDRLLSTGKFVAIGESLPYMPAPWDKTALVSRVDAIANIMKIVEVAQQHGVAARDRTLHRLRIAGGTGHHGEPQAHRHRVGAARERGHFVTRGESLGHQLLARSPRGPEDDDLHCCVYV